MPTNPIRVKALQDEIEWLNCQLEEYRSNDKKISFLPNMIFLIKGGRLIRAIKEYRDLFGCSLLEAKNAMYDLREDIVRGKYGEFDIEVVDPFQYVRQTFDIKAQKE
jgi:hypothetical protein